MSHSSTHNARSRLGIIGYGAFGRFIAEHLGPYFDISVFDPGLGHTDRDLEKVASCAFVVLAMPVPALREMVERICPFLQQGALVLDVCSVKVQAADILRAGIPAHVDVVATHPLFGPQSAQQGMRGLKIVLCPLHGNRHLEIAKFLRRVLGLQVIISTPEDHDREVAMVQGVTHLIAKVLTRMEPLPKHMTTRSFDLIKQAIDMVRDDAPEVFRAIEVDNPYAADVRAQFFDVANQLDRELSEAANKGR